MRRQEREGWTGVHAKIEERSEGLGEKGREEMGREGEANKRTDRQTSGEMDRGMKMDYKDMGAQGQRRMN